MKLLPNQMIGFHLKSLTTLTANKALEEVKIISQILLCVRLFLRFNFLIVI